MGLVPHHYVASLRHFAHQRPADIAISTPARSVTFAELLAHAESLASYLTTRGVARDTPVAVMAANSAELIEGFYAALVLGALPANVNPRYTAHEVRYVLENCSAAAVLFDAASAPALAEAVSGMGQPPFVLEMAGTSWKAALDSGAPFDRELCGDDRLLIYTGGTTGVPRAVEWLVGDHFQMIWQMVKTGAPPPTPESLTASGRRAPTALPCSPILHAAGLSLMLNTLNGGGTVVVSDSLAFDAAATFEMVQRHNVAVLGIVGDAFAHPMLTELETGRWTGALPSLRAISSAGAAWSSSIRDRMAELLPNVKLVSNFGSTEALVARDVSGDQSTDPGGGIIVIGKEGKPAGPGEVGMVAVTGHLPLGYLGEPQKTAETFRTINDRRYAVTGDEARVEPNGRITLLGRGSAVINTGGEKVWPDEVEAVLRTIPGVLDVVVVGRPDERWGQRVAGVLKLAEGADLSDAMLTKHCREKLSAYKCPRQWLRVDGIPRTPVGKPDYRAIERLMRES
ncbi:AMP-binding protein [Mycobacterium sp. CVI_P3]|uniref:AMP-binding protein n=1 Tax=Mycobacterium pinniadriaticum TaxID=2994102 RepID=A0ABT3SNE2_9MYCO|nr:AMP-binding protein [Mycobacterium pinniadriaticum]MCX2934434.1 AMP-binding protein [Mycobacterium pinniadriaticum]MCX2940857.1 AMP-binding protein [Mycobacterium pinniadriaticum]